MKLCINSAVLVRAGLTGLVMLTLVLSFGQLSSPSPAASIGSIATPVPTIAPISAPASSPRPKPTPPPPVPFSPEMLPPMTPIPTHSGPEYKPTPSVPYQPPPTPKPSDPYHLTAIGHRRPDTARHTREATVIAIGTVKQVLPARWTTPNGQRPANPHDPTNREAIFRPVLIEVEQYLKGQQPQSQLFLFAYGGVVGQDSVEGKTSNIHMFVEGERVIVFLIDRRQTSDRAQMLNGSPLWGMFERYTITQDGRATNSLRTVPLQQLLEGIRGALNP